MPVPMYVASLVALLRHAGWEQQAIAERLGVSKTAISLWAGGKRAISRRHECAFLDLVEEVLRGEIDRAGLNSARAHELVAYIDAWLQEMHIKVGTFRQSLQRQFEILQSPLAKMDPLSLSYLDRRTLRTACQMIVHYLDYLESVGKPVRSSRAIKGDPAEFFHLVCEMYRSTEGGS